MRKSLIVAALVVAGVVSSTNRASAFGLVVMPTYASAAFPCLTPSGYFTNSYYFAWYYPWYSNYNYSHGPYSNWWWWGGYATYGGCCGPKAVAVPVGVPAQVTVALPADAKLLFNGTAALGTGASRTFVTPPLVPGQEYAYELAAEVTVDGTTVVFREKVVVRAGQEAKATLLPPPPK